MKKITSVFFDIGDTLGTPKFSSPPSHLEGLYIYPYIPDILQQLKANDLKLGIISNTGSETEENMKRVLEEAGIYSFFDPNLLIYSSVVGVSKPSPKIFRVAAKSTGFSEEPKNCLFVGEDSAERKAANDLGWQVVPHPCLVWDVLNGNRLRYIRVAISSEQTDQSWRSVIRGLSVVPLYVTGKKGNQVYAIATTASIPALINLGFQVDLLGSEDAPLTTELYLLRDDQQTRTGFLNPQGQSTSLFVDDEDSKWVLASTSEGLYVALPGNRSVEEYHFAEAYHGHNLKLLPDFSLLEPFGEGNNSRTAEFLQAPSVEPSLSDIELEKLKIITPDSIRKYLEKYTGLKPLDESTGFKIKSRHIHSPDIGLVTEALAKDLEKIGGGHFSIRMNRFVHEGRELNNVEAPPRPIIPMSIPGDVDLDSDVDRIDVALILLAAQNNEQVNPGNAMLDVNRDGVINRTDASLAKDLCTLRLCNIPIVTPATVLNVAAVYDSNTGILNLNDIQVNNQHYRAQLQLQDENIFVLNAVQIDKSRYAIPVRYDIEGGILEIPSEPIHTERILKRPCATSGTINSSWSN